MAVSHYVLVLGLFSFLFHFFPESLIYIWSVSDQIHNANMKGLNDSFVVVVACYLCVRCSFEQIFLFKSEFVTYFSKFF